MISDNAMLVVEEFEKLASKSHSRYHFSGSPYIEGWYETTRGKVDFLFRSQEPAVIRDGIWYLRHREEYTRNADRERVWRSRQRYGGANA